MRSGWRSGVGMWLAALALAAGSFGQSAPGDRAVEETDDALRARIDAFVDAWHDDAAHARLAYFDKIASDGVYIGTDRTERWTRDEFREWARPYFERPSAWAFTVIHRNVDFSPDRSIAWFDEQLESRMGILQASGVIRVLEDRLEIAHYQLSIAVPNEVQPAVSETIRQFEERAPEVP